MLKDHPAYKYAEWASKKNNKKVPKYVKLQCKQWLEIADGKSKKYFVDEKKVDLISKLLQLMIMPKGYCFGLTVAEAFAGFQWFFITAILCTVEIENPQKRKYENADLEIARKNGKTFLIAVLFILLFFTEPKFSKFFSVAPDGSLSREIKTAIEEIIRSSPALLGHYKTKDKFKILRNEITCNITDSVYKPLNYSYGRLDGKLPSVFLADEVGALPNNYAVEAMRSGQLTILNKLGFVISTKYPNTTNPFEDEVTYSKKVLDGLVDDEKNFALLYEPDNKIDWETDVRILEHANPLALEQPKLMEDLLAKRAKAVEMESLRSNFLCKHCNIISEDQTECYIPIDHVKSCRVQENEINWQGKEVYLGVDLALSNDNCAVAMVSLEDDKVIADCWAFIPQDRILEKNSRERIDYNEFIKAGKCIACGDLVVDYSVIENFVLDIEDRFGCTVEGIGFDRWNAMSSAQKWEQKGYQCCEIKQHSSVLHPATKWLLELVESSNFAYEPNKLLEINFQNARCVYDTNLNRYVNKKKSTGKIDMVVALINAVYMLQQNTIFTQTLDWGIQF